MLQKAFQQQHIVDRLRPQHFAAPLSSVLHNLCMKNMQDLHSEKIEGGVDYSYFEFLGYATVVDSLAAIKKLVFEEKRLTMREVLDAMNIPRYELAGYEADDLIGTISRRCEAAGWDCVIVTGGKDRLQLVTVLHLCNERVDSCKLLFQIGTLSCVVIGVRCIEEESRQLAE